MSATPVLASEGVDERRGGFAAKALLERRNMEIGLEIARLNGDRDRAAESGGGDETTPQGEWD